MFYLSMEVWSRWPLLNIVHEKQFILYGYHLAP